MTASSVDRRSIGSGRDLEGQFPAPAAEAPSRSGCALWQIVLIVMGVPAASILIYVMWFKDAPSKSSRDAPPLSPTDDTNSEYVSYEEKSFLGKMWSYPVIRYVSYICGVGLLYYGGTTVYAHFNPEQRTKTSTKSLFGSNNEVRIREKPWHEYFRLAPYNEYAPLWVRCLQHPFTVMSGGLTCLYTFWRYVYTTFILIIKPPTTFWKAVDDKVISKSNFCSAVNDKETITLKQDTPSMTLAKCVSNHQHNKSMQRLNRMMKDKKSSNFGNNACHTTVWKHRNRPSYTLGGIQIQEDKDDSWSIFGSKTDRTMDAVSDFKMRYVVPHWFWSDEASTMEVHVADTKIGLISESIGAKWKRTYSFGIKKSEMKLEFKIETERKSLGPAMILRGGKKIGSLTTTVNEDLYKAWNDIETSKKFQGVMKSSATLGYNGRHPR